MGEIHHAAREKTTGGKKKMMRVANKARGAQGVMTWASSDEGGGRSGTAMLSRRHSSLLKRSSLRAQPKGRRSAWCNTSSSQLLDSTSRESASSVLVSEGHPAAGTQGEAPSTGEPQGSGASGIRMLEMEFLESEGSLFSSSEEEKEGMSSSSSSSSDSSGSSSDSSSLSSSDSDPDSFTSSSSSSSEEGMMCSLLLLCLEAKGLRVSSP